MYTPEEEIILKEEYDGSPASVAALTVKLNKSTRSIIGKLSKMGIYQKATYKSKNDESPVTKLEILSQIEAKMSVRLPGLEKAPKQTLKILLSNLRDT